jgi:hypothetical protein
MDIMPAGAIATQQPKKNNKSKIEPGIVKHSCYASTQEVEAEVQDQPGPHSETVAKPQGLGM